MQARNWPETLKSHEKAKWKKHCSDQFEQQFPERMSELNELREIHSAENSSVSILNDLERYYQWVKEQI